jgi:chromosome segregation ATPase
MTEGSDSKPRAIAPNESFAFQLSQVSSSSSSDKDPLIDEMQVKIGELLRVSQELSAAKNQIHSLKETLSRQTQQFGREREQFQATIADLEGKLRTERDRVSSLEDSNEELTRAKAELETENADLNDKMAKLKARAADMEQAHSTKLTKSIAAKERQITELHSQLKEAQSSQSSSSDSIARHRTENTQLQERNKQLSAERNEKAEEIVKLTAQLQMQQIEMAKVSEANQQSSAMITALQHQLEGVKSREQLMTKKFEMKSSELTAAQNMLQRALAVPPGFNDVESLHRYLREKEAQIDALSQEVKKGNSTIKKSARTIKKLEEDLRTGRDEAVEAEAKNSELEQVIAKQTVQIARLTKTNTAQGRRLKVIPVYDRVNRELSGRIAQIRGSIEDDGILISVRSLITLAVSLLRWRGFVGLERVYTTDSRNFWWIGAGCGREKSAEEVISVISNLKAELSESKKQSGEFQHALEEAKAKLSAAQQDSSRKDDKLDKSIKSLKTMEQTIANLERAIEGKIDRSLFAELEGKLAAKKGKYHTAKAVIKQKEGAIATLDLSLNKMKQQYIHQLAVTKQREKQLDDANYELYQAQDGVAFMKQGNAAKTKDLLALERGIEKQTRIARISKTETDVLALENRRLHFQLAKAKDGIEIPRHAFVERNTP